MGMAVFVSRNLAGNVFDQNLCLGLGLSGPHSDLAAIALESLMLTFFCKVQKKPENRTASQHLSQRI